MSFPATLALVTVAIQFDLPPDGGATGKVTFTAPGPLTGAADGSVVPPAPTTVTLAANGSASVQLPATNDPQWTPAGWTYTVEARVAGTIRTGTLALDYQTTSVQLADLIQWDGTVDPGTSYIPLSQKGAYGGVAELDASTGEVLDGNGDAVGGGGGGTASATVVSETAYGQSATAGAASAYSRGDHTHGTPAAPAAATISDSTATGQALVTAASAAAARTTLGLGGAAVLAVGTTAGTVAAGDAPAAGVTAHEAAGDPHAQYLTAAEGNAAYQPLDSDLTTIAGLTATTDNMIQSVGSAWASRTPAQVRTALTLVPAIILASADPIPGGTPTNTLIIRTT